MLCLILPRDSKKSVFSGGLGLKIFWEGMLIGLLTFAAYAIGYYLSPNGSREITAQTMAFMVLSLSQLAHALNSRSDRYSAFKLEFSKPMAYLYNYLFHSSNNGP